MACNRAALVALLDGFARNGTVVDTSPTTPFYAKAEAYVAAVSYTHLTLPTILLV